MKRCNYQCGYWTRHAIQRCVQHDTGSRGKKHRLDIHLLPAVPSFEFSYTVYPLVFQLVFYAKALSDYMRVHVDILQ